MIISDKILELSLFALLFFSYSHRSIVFFYLSLGLFLFPNNLGTIVLSIKSKLYYFSIIPLGLLISQLGQQIKFSLHIKEHSGINLFLNIQ
jgi:hypothetical protein